MKNKLFVLKMNNDIIAITEYEYHMRLFILQNEYSKNEYYLKIITNKDKINKYLIKYDDEYIIEYKDFVIRAGDKKHIEDMIYSYRSSIRDIENKLCDINLQSIMSPEEHRILRDCIELLHTKTKKKNIDEFINIHGIIRDFCNDHKTRYDLQEMNNAYQYNLLKN